MISTRSFFLFYSFSLIAHWEVVYLVLNLTTHLEQAWRALSKCRTMRNVTKHSNSRSGRKSASIAFSPRRLARYKGWERLSVAMLRSFYRRALHRNIKRGLPGCAYINNNCRANNKPEGSTLDSPKLLVPLPRGARFYCLLSSVRNGGSPLHRPRWRINDPAIRRRELLLLVLRIFVRAFV